MANESTKIDWLARNENRKYPVDDAATARDNSGIKLPDDIINDIQLRWDGDLGNYAFITGLSITPKMLSVIICVAETLTATESTPIAALTILRPAQSQRIYQLTPMHASAYGLISFGDVNEEVSLRFSTAAQSFLCPSVAQPSTLGQVKSIGTTGSATRLRKIVTLRAGKDITLRRGTVFNINENFERQAIFVGLAEPDGDNIPGRKYLGDCNVRPESGDCAGVGYPNGLRAITHVNGQNLLDHIPPNSFLFPGLFVALRRPFRFSPAGLSSDKTLHSICSTETESPQNAVYGEVNIAGECQRQILVPCLSGFPLGNITTATDLNQLYINGPVTVSNQGLRFDAVEDISIYTAIRKACVFGTDPVANGENKFNDCELRFKPPALEPFCAGINLFNMQQGVNATFDDLDGGIPSYGPVGFKLKKRLQNVSMFQGYYCMVFRNDEQTGIIVGRLDPRTWVVCQANSQQQNTQLATAQEIVIRFIGETENIEVTTDTGYSWTSGGNAGWDVRAATMLEQVISATGIRQEESLSSAKHGFAEFSLFNNPPSCLFTKF